MKKIKLLVLISLAVISSQCNSSKILTINSHLAIIDASRTDTLINRTPGALLKFVVVTNENTTLDSVIFWGIKKPLTVTSTSKDTVWAEVKFVKPIPERAVREEEQTMAAVMPPDTTCFITYSHKEEYFKIKIPRLKVTK